MSNFYKLSIQEIKRETSQTVSVLFNVPMELQPLYQFIAGQYVTLKLTLDGVEIRRAYSICSSPTSGELRIAIKAIKNGTFSKFANEKLAVGNVLEVGIPEGKFVLEPSTNNQNNYLVFTAGSGITPIVSILQSVLEHEPKSNFVLIYGNKNPKETIFYNLLQDLQEKYSQQLFIHFVYSEVKVSETQFGRINKSIVNYILHTKHKNLSFSTVYLCGPEQMINNVTEVLLENSIPKEAIKFELFAASNAENTITDTHNEHTKVTFLVDGVETSLEMSNKQSLLEVAVKNGVDAPYSCQGGVCSSCLARVTTGSAMMKKNAILTDSEIAEGLVLTCQAYPTSNTLFVNFDDV